MIKYINSNAFEKGENDWKYRSKKKREWKREKERERKREREKKERRLKYSAKIMKKRNNWGENWKAEF